MGPVSSLRINRCQEWIRAQVYESFRPANTTVEQLEEARAIWQWGGLELPAFDAAAAIEPYYVNQLATDTSLQPVGGELVNSTFQPLPMPIERAGLERLIDLPSFAELPCREFEYEPDSPVLTPVGLASLRACTQPLSQLLKLSDSYLLITGWSAWPGPEGTYQETHIKRFARMRAIGLQTALIQELGIPPERIEIQEGIPPIEDRNSRDEATLDKYRIVVMELKRAGR